MNDLDERIEAAEKKLEVLYACMDDVKQEIEELKEVKAHVEIPDFPVLYKDEQYWFVEDDGTVTNSIASGGIRSDFNNFHVETYAQEFADKCKLIAMMLHCKWYLCPDYVPDFTNSNEEKHYVYYDVCSEKYTADYRYATINNEVFFDTKENAKKAADWLNEHWKEDGNG